MTRRALKPLAICDEMRFVALLSMPEMTAARVVLAKEWMDQGLDWALVARYAAKHRVQPVFSRNLKALGAPCEPCLAVISAESRRYALDSMRLVAETVRIFRCFQENGVRALSLKGPALAADLYGSVSLRPSKDIDILVDDAQLEKAQELLEKLGYQWQMDRSGLTTPKRLALYKRYYHHWEYVNAEGVAVELHWTLQCLPRPFESLYSARGVAALSGFTVPVMGDADRLVYLIVHGVKHGFYRLRWLMDLRILCLRGGIDYDGVFRLFREMRLGFAFLEALALLYMLDPLEMPEIGCVAFRFAQNGRDIAIRTKAGIELTIALHMANLAGRLFVQTDYAPDSPESRRYQDAFKRVLLFRGMKAPDAFSPLLPKQNDFEALDLPDRLFFLYYAVHPMYKLFRIITKGKA